MPNVTAVQRGDIIFVCGTGLISEAIEDITRSVYSHVALAVSADTFIEAQGWERVEVVPSSKYAGHADVYRTSLSADALDMIVAKAETHIGERYDYFLVALELVREGMGISLPYDEAQHHDLICSMLIADAFRPEYDPCPGIEYPTPGDEAKSSLWSYQFALEAVAVPP